MAQKYRDASPVIMPEQGKMKEMISFREICGQFPIEAFGFRKGIVSPNHDVLAVRFVATHEGRIIRFLVDITPSFQYPDEEPGAVLIEPDISWIPRNEVRLHVYDDLEGRLLCTHSTDWHYTSTMAKFFANAVVPWANNFTAWFYTNGLWTPELWITGGTVQ